MVVRDVGYHRLENTVSLGHIYYLSLSPVSIAMVADYSFDMKNIDIWAPAFFKHNDSFIVIVHV